MGLRGYIVKRIIYTIFLIVFVATLNFIIFEVMPNDPVAFFVTPPHGGASRLTQTQINAIDALWGLNLPWPVKYAEYLRNMLTFQFGKTNPLTGVPVIQVLMQYLPNTLILMGLSTIFAILIGVTLGVIAAYKRGGLFDNGAVIVSLVTYSLPTFWMGLLLISVFAIDLHWLPANQIISSSILINPKYAWNMLSLFGTHFSLPTLGEVGDRIVHLIMPVTVLTLFSYGGYVLLTRATMLESLTEDYILTAKAKGLKERTIIFKHALKNASLPIITSSALAFGFLIGGAIITETVFSYQGIGWLTINSILETQEYPILQAIFYITALCVIIANFVSDLLYGVIDPRIKYG
jgi:peptide/nickel transport system permease protein